LVPDVVIGVARAIAQGVHRGRHLTGEVIDSGVSKFPAQP
jgi:hypothetical protein